VIDATRQSWHLAILERARFAFLKYEKKIYYKATIYGTLFALMAIWGNFSGKGEKPYYPSVKNTPFVLPNRSKPTLTPTTCSDLLYFQKIRIYFCVRIDFDAQL
jgi:hypothetical protein